MDDGCSSHFHNTVALLKHQEPMARLFPCVFTDSRSNELKHESCLSCTEWIIRTSWGLYTRLCACVCGHHANVSCSIAVTVTPHEGHEGTQITGGCTKQLQRTTKAAVGQAKDHDLWDSSIPDFFDRLSLATITAQSPLLQRTCKGHKDFRNYWERLRSQSPQQFRSLVSKASRSSV